MITQSRMTEEEFLRLPDDGRKWELVNGEAKEVPTSYEHDIIGATAIALLRPFARGIGFIAGSQAGFRMANGNVRSPDVSFMRKSRLTDGKPSKGFQSGAPDLCVEIISPSEEPAEMRRKVAEYFASCAKQVWHLFPEAQQVIVYTSRLDSQTYEADDELSADDLLPGFRSRTSDLFALE